MKLISFSFKREPVWMLVLSLAAAAGLFVFVVLLVLRSSRYL